jgi:hypothetical protein
MSSCRNCDGQVCRSCGTIAVSSTGQLCQACGDADADWSATITSHSVAEPASPEAHAEIVALEGQIVRAGGPGFLRTHRRLNREMGIRSRNDATTKQLHHGLDYAGHWLIRLYEKPTPVERQRADAHASTPADAASILRALAEHLATTTAPLDERVLRDLACAVHSLGDTAAKFVRDPQLERDESTSPDLARILTHLHEGARNLQATADLGLRASPMP